MSNYIVLRLVPPSALDAGTFTTDLQNLTVSALPLSYNDPNGGPAIGSATFLPPAFPPPPGTQIVQHATPLLDAVATALIEILGPLPPFVNFLVQLQWAGGQTTVLPEPYYVANVVNIPGPFPAPIVIETIPDADVSAFVTLPPPSQLIVASAAGAPPNFDTLLAAITTILGSDPGIVANSGRAKPIDTRAVPQHREGNRLRAATAASHAARHARGHVHQSSEHWRHHDQPGTTSGRIRGPAWSLLRRARCAGDDARGLHLCLGRCELARAANTDRHASASDLPRQSNRADAAARDRAGRAGDFQRRARPRRSRRIFLCPDLQPPDERHPGKSSIARLRRRSTEQPDRAEVGHRRRLDHAAAAQSGAGGSYLGALNIPPASTAPTWPIANPSANEIFEIGWAAPPSWLGFPTNATWVTYTPADDLPNYWTPLATHPGPFLDLVLAALTQGFTIGANSLADEIKAHLLPAPLTNVSQIENATPADWENLFATLPAILGVASDAVLPPFTLPGSVAERVNAFIAYVQRFFAMGTAATVLNPSPRTSCCVSAFPPTMSSSGRSPTIPASCSECPSITLRWSAAAVAALGDERAQQWAVQAVETLNELFILSQIFGESAAFDFSIMEALFARGFTSREQVLEFPLDEFTQALTGTIAYDHAAAIYANAGPAPVFPPPPGGGPGPINPGNLTDCIPPLWLSPLGPVAYLHEMLNVSQRSRCDHPFAPPAPGHTTLGAQISVRRGPVGQLIVSRSNLETPLPMIDMVNECLEFMASTTPPTAHGVIYDTTERKLAGYELCDDRCDDGPDHHDCGCEARPCGCEEHHKKEEKDKCHDPALIFGALPEYSTPATPVPADTAVSPPLPGNLAVTPAVWEKLKSIFDCCCLPYNQALDVNRTYLDYFRSCRFEEMRTFRKCITELVLNPEEQPADFQSHLWRWPPRLDIAIEYLGISEEEYVTLFNGVMPGPCGPKERRDLAAPPAAKAGLLDCFRLDRREPRICLPEFLRCACLTYCEFYELWKSGFVKFSNAGARDGKFPECEPCCLDDLCLRFPEGKPIEVWLEKLIIFVRLWKKLRHRCGAGYSFAELADICEVLELGDPQFIRRLAAFQLLRDQFRLPLTGREPPPFGDGRRPHAPAGAVGRAGRDAPGVGVGGPSPSRRRRVARPVQARLRSARGRFIKLLEANLDPLSALAGFDPHSADMSWHKWPQHTLRFAEILAKIYASDFTVGEISYCVHADFHLDGDDPYPLQDENEARDLPLGLPDDENRVSLWRLRHKMLGADVAEDELKSWTWPRIAAALMREFGFPDATVSDFGTHFFPRVLAESGMPPAPGASRFSKSLIGSSSGKWNSPPAGPFHYDAVANILWTTLPLRDAAVLGQLTRCPPLDPAERKAAQDVYFLPRQMLADFAMFFEDFDEAQRRLIEDENRAESWRFFRRRFALTHARAAIIAEHLAEHVETVTGQERPEGREPAHLVLKSLYADENEAAAWEDDSGAPPPVTWQFTPASPGYAAPMQRFSAWREPASPANSRSPTAVPSFGGKCGTTSGRSARSRTARIVQFRRSFRR